VAVPDQATYPGADYYVIGIREYAQRMHSDLQKATRLRGYYQKNAPAGHPAGQNQYLGPVILAQRDRPVRLKVVNELPTATEFFIPVDTTVMGAGKGNRRPDGSACDPMDPAQEPACASFSQSRAGVHLHGGFTPWISDGTPHQWITPAGEATPYPAGVATRDVPDMAPADPSTLIPAGGSTTLYYPNQQSGRLMFYHDHAYGITRLNVYGGMAAGYLLTDPRERALTDGTLPAVTAGATTAAAELPLVIQDKTFVPQDVAVQDARWDTAKWGQPGDLWFPHVYEANQDPSCTWGFDCMSPIGRWDYGPWIWPPVQLPAGNPQTAMDLAASQVPEAFMDVMVVNGTAYPSVPVERKAYRLRVLNASNDRFLNLQLYYAITADSAALDPTRAAFFDKVGGARCDGTQPAGARCTEVAMVPRDGATYTTPFGDASTVPFDGRPGGAPDPRNAGPKMLQIGTEGGLLPRAVTINAPPIPVTYDTDPKSMTVGNVIDGTLRLGPAERADLVVDFSAVPAGARLILYNDAPAAYPAGDQRYDYYTFGPDWTDNGGAKGTLPGYGPNTRTVLQFEVRPTAAVKPFDFAALSTAVPAAYAATQERPIVPEPEYRAAFPALGGAYQYGKIFNTTSFTYSPTGKSCALAGNDCVTLPIHQKAIAEEFDPAWGRMSALLGTEAQVTGNQGQNTFGFYYVDPATEVIPMGETQIWKLTHNGVDTHAIHFHLVNVQVINRVDWAGVVKPPDANELGWKETVRMNPLEDILIAVKAAAPRLPFAVPESNRLRDQTRPAGATNTLTGLNFTVPWPYVQPQGTTADPVGTTTVNAPTSYGWEYVWHCHLLGHEENDMMRPLVMTNVTSYVVEATPPAITAAPAAATLRPGTPITVTAADVAPATCQSGGATTSSCQFLVSGLASLAVTVNGAPVAVAGGAATIPTAGLADGTVLTVVATATDQAATPNTATATFTYTVDALPPVITFGAVTPAPTAFGWNNSAVTIPFTAADARSNPVTTAPVSPLTFTAQGANQSKTVVATDAVGNATPATASPKVSIDLTAPKLAKPAVSPTQQAKKATGTYSVSVKGSKGAVTDAGGAGVDTSAGAGTFSAASNKPALGGEPVTGTFTVLADGSYTFTAPIPGQNAGTPASNRVWTITVTVKDRAGNATSGTGTFTVLK
jgi:FtsP/CotA-like multicopper oxidase with cupredoxin domain